MRFTKQYTILIVIILALVTVITAGITFRRENSWEFLKKNEELVSRENLKQHISFLASDQTEGRRAGTGGEGRTGDYLALQFQKYGLLPAGLSGTFCQPFPVPNFQLREEGRAAFRLISGVSNNWADNILGIMPGKDPVLKEDIIVISAHYDHLGKTDKGLYRGANDNASGVAAMLEILRLLAQRENKPRRTVLFAAWSGEEMGLLGSNYFIQHPTLDLSRVKGVINIDSIAAGDSSSFLVWSESSSYLLDYIMKKDDDSGIILAHQPSGIHTSDHAPFVVKGIPAVTLLADEWLKDNHTLQDDLKGINLEKVVILTKFVSSVLNDLLDRDNIG